jgi:cell fate regulator YaaT (PSP1 superfamily)
MKEKSIPNINICLSEHHQSVNKQYDNLIIEKISDKNGNNNGGSKLVIAKCNGLLGINICSNNNRIEIAANDQVVIKINDSYEFAEIIETGTLVDIRSYKLEMEEDKIPSIERVAKEKDIERNITNKTDADDAKSIFKDLVEKLGLNMKLVDVHYQFDRKKIFFFYTSDGRVDFRELAKKLAAHFKTRIELRQIGVRDEAKMLGGIATCGREYCCATFMCSFKKITAEDAYKNNITQSISKYTGPCGKLKCCLAYDLE